MNAFVDVNGEQRSPAQVAMTANFFKGILIVSYLAIGYWVSLDFHRPRSGGAYDSANR